MPPAGPQVPAGRARNPARSPAFWALAEDSDVTAAARDSLRDVG